MQRIPDVVSADLNFASATLLVSVKPGVDIAREVVRVVESTGHGATPLISGVAPEAAERPWFDRYRADIATAGSGAFAVVGFALEHAPVSAYVPVTAFAVAIAFGGLLVWKRALVSMRARILDMNVLMSLAVIGAAALGEWGEGATVFFLFALGGLLESRSLERTRRSIRDLMSFAPARARVVRGERTEEVAVEQVLIGERVMIRPGERVPVDAVIDSGDSAVDEAPITGESVPVEKGPGDRVFAGTLNISGRLEVVVSEVAQDSTISRIVHLVEEAQATRAPSQTFVERFTRVYTPLVILIAALVAIVPPLAAMLMGLDGVSWAEWIRRSLVVLVVSCPCALVISTPVSIVSAITRASRDGVLVKGGAFLETARTIRVVALDKTGTITAGRPAVCGVRTLIGFDADELLSLAASLESHSNHPLARAVVAHADRTGVAYRDPERLDELPGRGVEGVVDGRQVAVLAPHAAGVDVALGEAGVRAVAEVEAEGATALVVFIDGAPAGLVCVVDEVRVGARAAVEAMSAAGVEHVVMLTGDNETAAAAVARAAGITEFRARLLPEHKTAEVERLRAAYGPVLMVGDGVNDAPALAASDIGVSMGAAGSDVALETADVALMSDELSQIARFLRLGRRTERTIRVNVIFSIAVKAVFLVLALGGWATLWMAVFADTGVSLLVILNGMRLLRSR